MQETVSHILNTYVFSYSGLAAMGILAVFAAAVLLCVYQDIDWVRLLPCMIVSFIPLYLGAKLFGILSLALYRLQYGLALDKTLFTNAGIVFYGGLLGYLTSNFFLVRRFVPDGRARAFDVVGVTVPLFHGFARIGCYIAGCCFGVSCTTSVCEKLFSGKLPVQLIESAFNFLLFVFLLILFYRRSHLRGRLVDVYLLLYAVFRFIIEFFRADVIRGGVGPLSFSQIVSLCILVYLIITYRKRITKYRQEKKP